MHDSLSLEKNSESKWHFEKPAFGDADYEGEPAPPTPIGAASPRITGVRELLQTASDLRVESDKDFGTVNANDAELAEKGLQKGKERLRVETKRQPSSFGSEEKKEPIQDALLIGNKADDKGGKYYARLESDRNIVKVPGSKVEALTKILDTPGVLRSHELLQIDPSHVDAINVKLHDQEILKMRKAGDPASWKLYDGAHAQEPDSGAVQRLLNELTAKRLVKDFPEFSKSDAALGLDKPATVVSLWLDGVKKEEKKEEPKDEKPKEDKKDEKKDDKAKDNKKDAKADESKKETKKDVNVEPALKDEKPTVRLSFGKKDKDVVYVLREEGGKTARLAVPASLLDKVSEGKLAYLDRKLPSFLASDVTKIVLNRGGDSFEIEKPKDDKGNNAWKMKQPKEATARNAEAGKVDRLISELRDLQAEKLIAEKASESELERFGLKNPAIKVTVTERKGEKETQDQVYLFGKETDDKSGIYAKQAGRDMVFVVRKKRPGRGASGPAGHQDFWF